MSDFIDPDAIQVRRATLEDIDALTQIWGLMRFEPEVLAKRVTEFQVAIDDGGNVLGAVALAIHSKQGLIHSEGFRDFAVAEYARPLLWDRLNLLAANHGLLRLWTLEEAPFWSRCGLAKADSQALKTLPSAWNRPGEDWLTLKLRDDLDTILSLDREFALFMQAEKEKTRRRMRQAAALKYLATLVALLVLGLVLAGAYYLLRRSPYLSPYLR